MNPIRIMLPAGTYFIGDPTRVLDQDTLEEINSQNEQGPVYEAGGAKFVMVSIGGDGAVSDTDGISYEVESGSLGAVPLEAISLTEDDYSHFGRIISYESPVLFKYVDGELLVVGNVVFNLERTVLDPEEVMMDNGKDFWEVWE